MRKAVNFSINYIKNQNKKVNHYRETLGAKRLSHIEVYIDSSEAAVKLIQRYYNKN